MSAIADLVFLVDGSWSVGRENFRHIRSFIASLAGAFDIGEDKTRVAVVQYSTDTRTEFNLTQYNRRGDLLQAINSLPYKGGNTMTGKALSSGGGPEIKRPVVPKGLRSIIAGICTTTVCEKVRKMSKSTYSPLS